MNLEPLELNGLSKPWKVGLYHRPGCNWYCICGFPWSASPQCEGEIRVCDISISMIASMQTRYQESGIWRLWRLGRHTIVFAWNLPPVGLGAWLDDRWAWALGLVGNWTTGDYRMSRAGMVISYYLSWSRWLLGARWMLGCEDLRYGFDFRVETTHSRFSGN